MLGARASPSPPRPYARQTTVELTTQSRNPPPPLAAFVFPKSPYFLDSGFRSGIQADRGGTRSEHIRRPGPAGVVAARGARRSAGKRAPSRPAARLSPLLGTTATTSWQRKKHGFIPRFWVILRKTIFWVNDGTPRNCVAWQRLACHASASRVVTRTAEPPFSGHPAPRRVPLCH